MPNRTRRRATSLRMTARRRSTELARRLGTGLREARRASMARQADVAERAGVSQSWISRMERGLGQAASLETWNVVAAAVGLRMAAFLEDAPGADRPRDYEHLKRQQLIVETASPGGWRGMPELALDPARLYPRAIDIGLERASRREAAVIEIEDFLDDVGASLRGFDAKVAELGRRYASRPGSDGAQWRVGGLLVVRATNRNRALLREFRTLFEAHFTGSSRAWIAALSDPTMPMPAESALAWTDVAGTRLRPMGRG